MNVHFALPRTQDEAEFTTENPMAPGNLGVRWVTPGPGREELNQMLAELLILEVDHLAVAAANGESYRVEPLRELAVRDGWSLHSKVGEEPALYQLQRDGESTVSAGPRTDLLLILELLLRMALQLYEGQPSAPTWVARARKAHPMLVAALQGHDLLQPL